ACETYTLCYIVCPMDPEKLLQCPYDKNHQIRASRFPYHLVKCKKNNEKIAKQLVTCPYNARHRIPKDEFNSHIEICESKISSEVNKEDWEADADEASVSPFVFGARIGPRSNRKNRPRNNRLVQDWGRSTAGLYTLTRPIQLVCRKHHVMCGA
uniref:CHHC U11-48K-type domain-containing protein n=1 Tax=Anolis carolinensis TaxID=28377 RepID=A0A803TID5_ANOCA